MVERFFRDLTENRQRRGMFRSIEALIAAIDEYIDLSGRRKLPTSWRRLSAHAPLSIIGILHDAPP
jgi:hypothetical protein